MDFLIALRNGALVVYPNQYVLQPGLGGYIMYSHVDVNLLLCGILLQS